MTSDGISDEDWARVRELAVSIVNAGGEDERLVSALLHYLDSLEHRYGERPSIFATRADYVSDLHQRIALLERAYSLAAQTRDIRNCLYCADSLAEIYLAELADAQHGALWLDLERAHVEEVGTDFDRETYERRKAVLERLIASPPPP